MGRSIDCYDFDNLDLSSMYTREFSNENVLVQRIVK